jgi:hypothetical protein
MSKIKSQRSKMTQHQKRSLYFKDRRVKRKTKIRKMKRIKPWIRSLKLMPKKQARNQVKRRSDYLQIKFY